ncbi:Mis12-Mtw1 protein family-domain-containing protein [Epithele typhae]|uniref:Mis12-Mtw1 protein family-domain-containing protein n=1 Tax=Epithele typhae TaxID=378194 RepID=UPI002007D345|nr:Mis12-Mtw1 protein family-domain-containing protein [Epithele typhae]KAH9910123.1 Mis12-Mtw1 protein family-domain-containing protein [Epithele typhae]
MIPSQPQAGKRKATDDVNPLAATAGKKLKREVLNGEEQPGGLVIVRAPAPSRSLQIEPVPAEPRAVSRPPSRPPSAPPPSQSSQSSNPPAKKLRADGSSRSVSKSKDRDVYTTSRAEPEVLEDVRQMQSETESLKRRSQAAGQAAGALNVAVDFPPRTSRTPNRRNGNVDTTEPVASQETPQIEKNKAMRGETGHRRRSSVSRGKRVSSSYETTGVISHPHTSVSVSSFFKHIDSELPEPHRARQLLIWCSNRAMHEPTDQTPQASSSRRTSTNSGKDPPPLSAAQSDTLKRTQESLIKMLAEKKVDTNVYGGAGSQTSDGTRALKENEQNVRNRARETRFNGHIQRSKVEAEAWKELSDAYDGHRKSVQADLEKRRRALASAKSKGKERASADDFDDWDVERRDLPEQFLSSGSVDRARSIVAGQSSKAAPLRGRLQELEYSMDRLHTFANSALQTTRVSEADLNRHPSSLSSYVPPTHPRPPATDPQDLLRALSRIDAARPQAEVGDAARRAVREVQRAAEASVGTAERRLTGVPPPTPRKPPGRPVESAPQARDADDPPPSRDDPR